MIFRNQNVPSLRRRIFFNQSLERNISGEAWIKYILLDGVSRWSSGVRLYRGGGFGEQQMERDHSDPSPLNLTKFPSVKDFQYLALVG